MQVPRAPTRVDEDPHDDNAGDSEHAPIEDVEVDIDFDDEADGDSGVTPFDADANLDDPEKRSGSPAGSAPHVRTGMSIATFVVRTLSIASILSAVTLSVWRSVGDTVADREAVGYGVDEREVEARLDQVERNILDGDFVGARRQLDAVTGALGESSALRERARDSRRRLDIAESLTDAFMAEKAGDRERALAEYHEVIALVPRHAEALAAIARLRAAPALAAPTVSIRPVLPRRVERAAGPTPPAAAAPVSPAPAPTVAPMASATDTAAGLPSGLLPTTRAPDRDVFLPVGSRQ